MLLDPDPNPFAVSVEQDRDHEETPAPRNDRQQHKQPDVIVGEARGDGDQLVGDRRQALEQYDPRAVFGIAGTKRLDLVAIAVKLDQPVPERIVQQRADWSPRRPGSDGLGHFHGRFGPFLGNAEQMLALLHLAPDVLRSDTGGGPQYGEIIEKIGALADYRVGLAIDRVDHDFDGFFG